MTSRPAYSVSHTQRDWVVRCEWGAVGAEALVGEARGRGERVVAIVVDVLSFTTAVSVALDAGAHVLPYRWQDESVDRFAVEHDAVVAVGRSQVPERGPVSLSPASMRASLRANGIGRLVLPSPNGSTITAGLAQPGVTVLAGCLRNATSVGRHTGRLMQAAASAGERVAVVVVPAGERWPDGSLRPAAEDLWGAGAVIRALVGLLEHRAGPKLLSPESRVAAHSFDSVAGSLEEGLRDCSSGRELVDRGFADDVSIAGELDQTTLVPQLDPTGPFVPA